MKAKPVIIGPVTYLWLGKAKDDSDKLALLPRLLPAYAALLDHFTAQGVEWVQIDEPVLVTELDAKWRDAFVTAYDALAARRVSVLLATYFGQLQENLDLACKLPVDGLHVDAINAREEIDGSHEAPSGRFGALGRCDQRPQHLEDRFECRARLARALARVAAVIGSGSRRPARCCTHRST